MLGVIPGTGDEGRAALEQFKRDLPLYIEMQKAKASLTKATFDAYVKEGFTPDQALELCKECE